MSTESDRTPTDQKIFDATPTGQTLVRETSVDADDDLPDGPPTIRRHDTQDGPPTIKRIELPTQRKLKSAASDTGGTPTDVKVVAGTLAVTRGALLDDRWRTDYCLASGGYGDVWAGIDTIEDRKIAVKILRTNAGNNDPSAIARMRQEAEILSAISHPNIVAVYGFGTSPYGHYLVMELLEGHAIDQLLGSDGPIDSEAAIPMVRELLGALDVAHAKHIFHRDLKPENIIVVKDEQGRQTAKLVDFGIAKATRLLNDGEEGATLVQTRAGGFMGTPRYAAPEQAVGDPCGPNIDLFALGLVIAEWLTGRMRIDGERHADVMQQLLSPEPLDLSDVPYRWREWIALMITKNPRDRLQNAQEALSHLEHLVAAPEPELLQEHSHPRLDALPTPAARPVHVTPMKGSPQSAFAANDGPLELDYDRAGKTQPAQQAPQPQQAPSPSHMSVQLMQTVPAPPPRGPTRDPRGSSAGYQISRFIFVLAVGIISFAAFAVLILVLAGLNSP